MAETASHILGVQTQPDNFDGYFFLKLIVRAGRSIYDAHAALTDLSDQFVLTDALSLKRLVFLPRQKTRAGLERRCFNELFRLIAKSKQRLHFATQLGVALARFK